MPQRYDLDIAFFHFTYGKVDCPCSKGHVGKGWIDAMRRSHTGTIGNEQVIYCVQLIPFIYD
jgi:hypothetical protein